MTTERCCARCRALPGTCARQRVCTCHADYARELRVRDNWRDAQEAAIRRAQQAEESRIRSKEMEGFAPWR